MDNKYPPMQLRLIHLDADGKRGETELYHAGYALENTTPTVLRIWGDHESGEPYTILVPIDRVVTLAYWPE